MIQRLDISGVHMAVGDDLHKQIVKKIGKLDRYISRHGRASAHAEVKLKEGMVKTKPVFTCEVIFHLPNEVITIIEKSDNVFTSVNTAGEKLKMQLHKYKDMHASPKLRQRLLSRLRRKGNSPEQS